ncbi:MAG TPA: alkaline phosphatase family protein [Kofleriaceae bacterium]
MRFRLHGSIAIVMMPRVRTRNLIVALIVAGCSSPSAGTGPDSGPGGGGSGTDAAGSNAPPTVLPIKHVVVVVKENHTFDNYFGSFPGADGISQIPTTSGMITPPHAPDKTPRDLCHEHSCALADLAGGAMNGWGSVSGASTNGDNLVYAQYQESDIPNYWQYARHFALADRFFANVLGPSFPGHTEVLAAQAGWALGNPNTQILHPYWGCDQDAGTTVTVEDPMTCTNKEVFPCFSIPSVPDILPITATWKFYGTNFYVLGEIWSMFDAVDSIRHGAGWNNVINASQFDTDVDNGNLPSVSWLVDQDFNDEHPNVGGVCAGENWTVGHLNHLMASPYWKDTVILFTMDDFGGWYDHVAPPRQYGCNPAGPYGLGFRLPLIAISAYSKPGFVFHEVSEQASIPKFIERVFDAPALSTLDPAAQDGQANDLMNMFDFNQTPLPPLPLTTRNCP